jgi:hypothetical protein
MFNGETWSELPITAQVSGTAVTAAAATTLLPPAAVLTIPANYWKIGRKLQIEAWGRISSVITAPGTARFDIRMGGTVVWDGLAILLDTVAGHTDVGWHLKTSLTCRAIGASANFHGQGFWACEDLLGTPATAPKGSLVAILPWNTAPGVGGNFNSAVSQTLDLFFTQIVATGSCQLHMYDPTFPN